MEHGVGLISTIAAGLGLSLILGFLAVRLKLPALVGYLVAGILIGPATPGFDADVVLAQQLAEIGVMLLMFGVGLHFSLGDLLVVRRIALPGALVQITVATLLGWGIAALWGWSTGQGIVFGLALSCASTVVLLRALEARGVLDTHNGHIAVGWLVVEDLACVLALVLLPALAPSLGGNAGAVVPGTSALGALAVTLGKVMAFVVLMVVVGKRAFPWLLWQVARTGSRELFTLCVIAVAVGIAYAASVLFGVSFALGAFVAGMVLRESSLSHRAAAESLPLRDAFSVLFFVSVGMLFDPMMLIREPLHILIVVGIIMVGKTMAAFLIVLAFRYPLNTALTVSASLAQIGEFSFILASLGVSLGLLPQEGQNLVLAGALISIALNPFVFNTIQPVQRWIRSKSALAQAMERTDDPLAEIPATVHEAYLTGHVLIVGYGRVGARIGEVLLARHIPIVVAEENREIVERLRARGIPAVAGDASEPMVLIQAHVARARMLVVAIPDAVRARQMLNLAFTLRPQIEALVRVHSEEEDQLVRAGKAQHVFLGEKELADAMSERALAIVEKQRREELVAGVALS